MTARTKRAVEWAPSGGATGGVDSAMMTLGIDVGGTFTDLAMFDERTGAVTVNKTPTTPQNQAEGVLKGILDLGVDLRSVRRIVHGMTVATNAVLEGRGAKIAMFTTAGFRDVIEIGRTQRMTFTMFDPYFVRPQPIVPRPLRYEIRERLLRDGSVKTPLDLSDIRRACRAARLQGVESIAICFLNSYANPQHEQTAREVVEAELPGVCVSISSDVVPEYREYERFSTCVINAFVQPVMQRYLSSLEERLRAAGFGGPIFIMASNGGVMRIETASSRPVQTLFSGPAGGVVGSLRAATALGIGSAISYDMGGTSTDVCLARDGAAEISGQTLINGLPIRIPHLSINTVGAGGGSIAWADARTLRVGPESSGSYPGPVCYGRGGTRPTVTDANLVLGRLDARSLLGGRMVLDSDAATRAIADLGLDLGLPDHLEVAAGILQIAVVRMANAIREISVQKGHDPRDFVLVALGGAGPMHAAETAEEIGIAKVLIPAFPGNLSAWGLLSSEIRHDVSRSYLVALDAVDWADIRAVFESLLAEARRLLGIDTGSVLRIDRRLDLRYLGQAFELTVALEEADLNVERVSFLFEEAYRRQYGHVPGGRIQVVGLRAALSLPVDAPPAGTRLVSSGGNQSTATRKVYFRGAWYEALVLKRMQMHPGVRMTGPCVIEEFGATSVVPPGWDVVLDDQGALVLTLRSAA